MRGGALTCPRPRTKKATALDSGLMVNESADMTSAKSSSGSRTASSKRAVFASISCSPMRFSMPAPQWPSRLVVVVSQSRGTSKSFLPISADAPSSSI